MHYYNGNNIYTLIAYCYENLNDNDTAIKYLTMSEKEPNNADGSNSAQKADLLIKLEKYTKGKSSTNKQLKFFSKLRT